MNFESIVNRCIEAFTNVDSNDPYCITRYENMVSLLTELREGVINGTYPRDYAVLPLFHYIERNMYSAEMYDSVKELDKWYAENYRAKSEAIIKRERIRAYLLSEGGLSERRTDAAMAKLARHKDIYLEFAEYVTKLIFPENGITVLGYNAALLHQNYPLSPLGAYNYLIYLREMPEKALSDLKAGLPTKDSSFHVTNNTKEVTETMDEKKPGQVEETAQTQQTVPEVTIPQKELLEKLDALQQAVAGLQQSFDDKIAEDAHKNGLFDNMHRELTKFQNGAMDKIVDTMALDIIQLVDTTKGHIRVYEKKEPTEDNYKRLLRIVKGIAEDLQDILYRQNIESYRVEGHQVDVRRQKIIQTMPTDDQSKDNLVAVRAADGYEKDGKVLRPERIKIFKYSPDATESTDK